MSPYLHSQFPKLLRDFQKSAVQRGTVGKPTYSGIGRETISSGNHENTPFYFERAQSPHFPPPHTFHTRDLLATRCDPLYHIASFTSAFQSLPRMSGSSSLPALLSSRLSGLPASQCNSLVDSFGPVATGCRFDFTLLFEESILFLGPSIVFLILAGLRIWNLRREQGKVRYAPLQVLKIVSLGTLPTFRSHVTDFLTSHLFLNQALVAKIMMNKRSPYQHTCPSKLPY